MEVAIRNKIFKEYNYPNEDEFEKDVVINSINVFGESGIYFDIKARIKKTNKKTQNQIIIPDGYFLDLKLHSNPKLYLVENELSSHDLYNHISSQIFRFTSVSRDANTKNDIKDRIIKEIKANKKYIDKINSYCTKSSFDNLDSLIDYVSNKNSIGIVVIIDDRKEELEESLSILNYDIETIEFKKYYNAKNNKEVIYLYDHFQEDIHYSEQRTNRKIVDDDELDTIVVPAREDGFKDVFINQNSWYAIRISDTMKNKIKYIAAYQTAPVSQITHLAEVKEIVRYGNNNKYMIIFKSKAKKIKSIVLDNPNLAPQSPRYTCYRDLIKAKKMSDIF